MDPTDERTKKLKAGKEKLAAFLKKKSKSKKTDQENRNVCDPQNGEESGVPEVSSPSAFSVTDSDQFSFTSGDEWSAEEPELKPILFYQSEQADEQNETNSINHHSLGSPVLQFEPCEQNTFSDVESALSKRDELISKLTQSLQTSFWQNIPHDVMAQVQALAEHVSTLQAQLLQADQSLREQLELHENSVMALQTAKEQMLQLQFILNCKDAELEKVFQTVETRQSIHSLNMKATKREQVQESCLMCEQYSDKVRTLEQEITNKMNECERWRLSQHEWFSRAQKLLNSAEQPASADYPPQPHEQEASHGDREQLQVLEYQLAILRQEHHSEPSEAVMLMNSAMFEAETNDSSHPTSHESPHHDYATRTQHSECLSQIEYLTSLNRDLQAKLSSLSSVENDLSVLRCEYERLFISYHKEVQGNAVLSELCAEPNAKFNAEKDSLLAKIKNLQSENTSLEISLASSDRYGYNQASRVTELEHELQIRHVEIKFKNGEIERLQGTVATLRDERNSLKSTLFSCEERMASLSQKLEAAEHRQKIVELEGMTEKLKIEQAIIDVENRLKEKDLECTKYTEKIINLQDELLSNQFVHNMEMTEKKQQLECLENSIETLTSERTKLSEKVKCLEHQLKVECQQYMDNLQHVMAEKELECKQYTENIIRLQDELVSFRHAHDLEIADRTYDFEQIEERMEMLDVDRAILQQRVKELELRLASVSQQSVDFNDATNRKDLESSTYTADSMKIQSELLAAQKSNELQMFDTACHVKEIEGLMLEKTALSERVNALQQQLNAQCKQINETVEMKRKVESQLQIVFAEMEHLLKTVDALTTELHFLKKHPQASHGENKVESWTQDLNTKMSMHNVSVDSPDCVAEQAQDFDSHSYKVCSFSEFESSDLTCQKVNFTLHNMVAQFDHQQKLVSLCQDKVELLKAKISAIDMNEEMLTKTTLLTTVDDLLKAHEEFSNHMKSFWKQTMSFEAQKQETQSCQTEPPEEKTLVQGNLDQEGCQEALQAQLENTISQWQKLQFIVQEKEIELHRLQECFDEQQRICSSMRRSHEEQRCSFEAEIESLKACVEEKSKTAVNIDNQQSGFQPSVHNVSEKLNEISNKASENYSAFNSNDCIAQKEIEISDLKTSLALKESENSELVNSLTLFQEEMINLKNKISDLQHQGDIRKENMKHRESKVGVLEDSLYGSIDEKELDFINGKSIPESQMDDLKSVITEREFEIDRLKLDRIDMLAQMTTLKNQLEAADCVISDLKNCLAARESEISVLNDAILENKAVIDHVKDLLASRESEINVLNNTISENKAVFDHVKNCLDTRESEVQVLKNTVASKESEINVFRNSLEVKECSDKESEIIVFRNSLAVEETETNVLQHCLEYKESENISRKSGVLDSEVKIVDLTSGYTENSTSELKCTEIQNLLAAQVVEINNLQDILKEKEAQVLELRMKLSEKEFEILSLKCDFRTKDSEKLEVEESFQVKEYESHSVNMVIGTISNVEDIQEKLNENDTDLYSTPQDKYDVDSGLSRRRLQFENNSSDALQAFTEEDTLKERLMAADSQSRIMQSSVIEAKKEFVTVEASIILKDSESVVHKSKFNETSSQNDNFQDTSNQVLEEVTERMESLEESELEVSTMLGRHCEAVCHTDGVCYTDNPQTSSSEVNLELLRLRQSLAEKEGEVYTLKANVDETKNYILKLQATLSAMNEEMAAGRNTAVEKDSQIHVLTERLNESEIEIDSLKTALGETEYRMNKIMEEKDSEICVLKDKLSETISHMDLLRLTLSYRDIELDTLRQDVLGKESEISIMVEELSGAISRIDVLNHLLSNTQREVEDMKKRVKKKESEVCILNVKLSDASKNEFKEASFTEELSKATSRIDFLNEVVKNKNEELEVLKNTLESRDVEIRDLNAALLEANSSVGTLQIDLKNAHEELAAIKIAVENSSIELNKEVGEANSQVDALKIEIEKANVEVTVVKSSLESKDIEMIDLNERLQEANGHMDLLHTDLSNANEKLTALKNTLENKNIEICSLNEQLQSANGHVIILNAELGKANEELIAVKNTLENKNMEICSLNEQLQSANGHVIILNAELGKANEELIAVKNTLENKNMEICSLNEQLQSANGHVIILNAELGKANEELIAVKNTLENKNMEIDCLNKQNEQLQKVNSNVEILTNSLRSSDEELEVIKTNLENKDLEINTLNEQMQESKSHVSMLNAELKEANEELAGVKSSLDNKNMEISNLNEKLQEANSLADVLKTELYKINEKLTGLQNTLERRDMEITVLNEKHQELNSQFAMQQTDLQNTQEESAALRSSLESRDLKMVALNEQFEEANRRADVLYNELEVAKKELSAVKNHLAEKDSEASVSNEELQKSLSNVHTLHADLQRVNDELTAVNSSVINRDLEVSNLTEHLQNANHHRDVLNAELKRVIEEVTDVKNSLENKSTENTTLSEKLKEVNSHMDVLHADLMHANENIMTLKNTLENRDAEICSVSEQLQSANNHVVVLNAKLSEASKELTVVKGHLENEKMEIDSLIQQNKHLQEISSSIDILNSNLSSSNEEMAALKVTLENKDLEISTLNEKLQEANSLVNVQKAELDNISMELTGFKNTLESRDMEISTLNEQLQEASNHLNVQKTELDNTSVELISLKNTLENKDMKISTLNEKLQEANSHADAHQTDLKKTQEELASLKGSLESKEMEIVTLNEKSQEATSRVIILHNDLENTQEELVSIKSTLVMKTLEMCMSHGKLQEFNNNVHILHADLQKTNEDLAAAKSSLAKKDLEISSFNEQLHEADSQVDVLTTELKTTKEQVAAITRNLESKDTEIFTCNQKFQEVHKNMGTLNTDLAKTNEELILLKKCIAEKDSEICSLHEKVSMKECEVINLSEELAKAGTRMEELLLTQKHTSESLSTVSHSLLMNESEMATLKEQFLEASSQVTTLTATVSHSSDELTEMKDCVDKKQSEISALTEINSELVGQVNDLNDGVMKLNEDLNAVKEAKMKVESDYTVLEQQLHESLSKNDMLQSKLNESEQVLADLTAERGNIQTLEDQIKALEVNLNELKNEHSGLKQVLEASQENEKVMQSMVTQKELELSELVDQVTSLHHQMKEISNDADIRSVAEQLQKTDFETKQQEFEVLREKLLHEIENLNKYVDEKESVIAELKATDSRTEMENVLKQLKTKERHCHILEATVSAMTQEVEETSATILIEKLQLQELTEEIAQLTDNLNHSSAKLQEVNDLNTSLEKMKETLMSESHAHLTDIVHQREALEQQVIEMEGLFAQKEGEISEIMQSAAEKQRTVEQLSVQHLALERNYKTMLGVSSYLQSELQVRESTVTEQKLLIDEQSVRLNDLSESLTQKTQHIKEINDLNIALQAQIDTLYENKNDLEHRISKLQVELESQELAATQFMVEAKQLNEKLTQVNHDLDIKDATIFDLQHDCDMYLKEINHFKQELEQKDLVSMSLKQEVESSSSLMEKCREEKEMLKANFDSCMEEMQQKFSDQEIELKRLRAQLAEETRSVCQDQNQMKDIYEQQIGQMEEKLVHFEKQCERLEKELVESKAKSASAKDVYEHQLSEQELHLQSTSSELLKLKDHLSKITNNHKCEIAGIKRLHEIQTNELEETCVSLERTVAEQKRLINENAVKFSREKNDLEQNYEIQLSDVEEKRRICEMEISRLKKHLDEMKFDHEKDLQSLEKSCEARLYELEDKYCNATNELEKLRKSLLCNTGGFSEERQALEMRIDELETLRRDLQNKNSLLEDDIAMIRDQVQCREEEMKTVLTNAAEEQQVKMAEMTSEILQLQQQLSDCHHKHDDIAEVTKRECESQIAELQSRNKQLEEKICSLEIIIEDLSLQKDDDKLKDKRTRTPPSHTHENLSTKTSTPSQGSPERASTFSAVRSLEPLLDDDSLSDRLPSSDENLPIVEGFVAEPILKFAAPHRMSQSNIYNTSIEKADFVEEQADVFQPEIAVDSSNHGSGHPICEDMIRERFEPEVPDHFLLETLEEPNSTLMWQHKLPVCLSPSHMQAQQANFEFSTPDKLQRNEEFTASGRNRETVFSDFNTNCNNRDMQAHYGLEKSDVSFERRLNDIRDELEEEYVTKMRQQEVKLTLEFETNQAEYKLEMEQHFAQRMKAVRYEWERKFNKALQKVRKELEKKHMKELSRLQSDHFQVPMHQHHPTASPVASTSYLRTEPVLIASVPDGIESLLEAGDQSLKENQKFADSQDVQMEQVESTQTKDAIEEQQPETNSRESCSSSSTTSTPTLTAASSPVVRGETGGDEAESPRSEVSDTSSARERFLEELEEMSQQSSQDLPLEWELTSTVIESGNFEQEPEHQSVWEVFDGRCVRQDCQEVRHKFHTLYQWVVNLLGDGYDIVFDSQLKLLMEVADLPKNHENSSQSPSLNQSEIDSVNSSDSTTRDISYADLLARVLCLELIRRKLEEELAAQIDLNNKVKWDVNKQQGIIDAELKTEVMSRAHLQHQEGSFVDGCKEDNIGTLSNQIAAHQASNDSESVRSMGIIRTKAKQDHQDMENEMRNIQEDGICESRQHQHGDVVASGSEDLTLLDQNIYVHSNTIAEQLDYKHHVDYHNYGDSLEEKDTVNVEIKEYKNDGNTRGNEEATELNIPKDSYPQTTLLAQQESVTSVDTNMIIKTVHSGDTGSDSLLPIELLDLQDKELAEELNKLQKDLRETKEVFSKESVLFHEALQKENTLKNKAIRSIISDTNIATDDGGNTSDSKLTKIKADEDLDMLKQKLAICFEQNQMLENENVTLRKRIREQAALITFLKSRLQQKDQETEVWQKSVNRQLVTLQNQRCDLLQLLQDMDAGKESTLSGALQASLREESLVTVQEDLIARMEELDHLNKMLTQRQVELQHCEAERKHLEQLCLLKDEAEMQLMKQKRLMEEQLSAIECHLTERETILMEEKTQLLLELKEKGFYVSKMPGFSQSSSHLLSSHLPSSSVPGEVNVLGSEKSMVAVLDHNSVSTVLTTPQDVDRQHAEAVERLRAKLKKESKS